MDEREQWAEYQTEPTVDRRNALAERYLPMVRSIARKLADSMPPGVLVDEDDLVGYGALGLLYAINAFEPARGFKFATFATLRVRGAMLDGLRELNPAGRQMQKKIDKLVSENNGELSLEEVERSLGFSRKELQMVRQANAVSHPKSLSDVTWGEDERPSDMAICRRDTPDAHMTRTEEWKRLCRGMTTQERLVLIGYYRLNQTMKEIGESIGLSESRVSQMHSNIIERLRERLGSALEAPSRPTKRVRPAMRQATASRSPSRRPGVHKLVEQIMNPKRSSASRVSVIKQVVLRVQTDGPMTVDSLAAVLNLSRQKVVSAVSISKRVKVNSDGLVRVAE
jgi:RNA polymerase sigma factor for flagellar operon FliA